MYEKSVDPNLATALEGLSYRKPLKLVPVRHLRK
jgi:hypothetical protein